MTDPARAAFAQSIVRGLDDSPRWLSCRYLYDAEGSDLFERISEPVAVAVRSVAHRLRLRELLEESQRQAEELQTQQGT